MDDADRGLLPGVGGVQPAPAGEVDAPPLLLHVRQGGEVLHRQGVEGLLLFPDKGDEVPPLGEGGVVEVRLRPRGHGEEEGVLCHGPELEVHRVVGDGAGGVPGVEEARGQVPVPRLQGVVVLGRARLVLSHEDQQTALADDLRVAGEGGVHHEVVVVGGLQEEIAVEGDGPRGPGGEAHVRIRVAEVLLYHRGDVAVAADQLHLRPGGQVGGGLLPVRPGLRAPLPHLLPWIHHRRIAQRAFPSIPFQLHTTIHTI